MLKLITKISVVKSFDSTTDMAQMVGVEPTRQSPVLKHFELIFEKAIW